jgi:hypothetical protein
MRRRWLAGFLLALPATFAFTDSPQAREPKVGFFAKKPRKDGEVSVRHASRQEGGWSVAETVNFRIFHSQSRKDAERAARVLEKTRASAMSRWFGKVAEPWSPRCDVYLHPTARTYARTTGAPAGSPGHSTLTLDAGRVLARRVDVRAGDEHALTSVLPHETAHVVLAGRFGRHFTPRWADEGVAVLSEPRERVNLHLRNLPTHRREGTLFSVGKLMRMDQYPEPRLIGPFYAQSVSLVEFLCKKKDPATFTRFLEAGLEHGWPAALRRHYGWSGFAELDREWRRYAFGEAAVARVAGK